MKTPFVPSGTKSVCTNGLNPMGSDIVVSKSNNSNVRLMGGKLMATELDKPMNFACKWAGVIAAAIVALCVAMPFIVGMLVAVMVGIAASFSIGNAMCYIATMNTPWTHLHGRVLIENKKALTGKSTMQCMFGGSINIFFSPAVAGANARKNATGNLFQIFMGGVGGAGLKGLFQLGKSLFAIHWSLGIVGPLATAGVGTAVNKILAPILDTASDIASDVIVEGPESDSIEVKSYIDQSTSSDVAIAPINGRNKGLNVQNDAALKDRQLAVSRTEVAQSTNSTMTDAHASTRSAIKGGDNRAYKEIFAEKLKAEHSSRKVMAENRAASKITDISRTQRNALLKSESKKALIGFGFVALVDVFANTAFKVQDKKLAQWGDNDEARARARVNVTEKEV